MEHLLFEHPQGYLLFECKEYEDISKESFSEYLKLLEAVKLVGKLDFKDLDMAMQNITVLSDNKLPIELENFLDLNNVKVLYADISLKNLLNEKGIEQRNCVNLTRGIRHNLKKFLKNDEDERKQFLLSTSHAFSRNKVEYGARNEDSVLFHTVNMLDQIEKDINSYTMRVKEIYGWSFPELYSICKNNDEFIHVINLFLTGTRHKDINDELLKKIEIAKEKSIGMKISEEDTDNIKNLCAIIEKKIEIRTDLKKYLYEKVEIIAPNLSAYLGEYIAAKIIALAGGILNLAKAPASTIQLLGAEKSLFKSLKERSDTPKYGVLYHSNFVVKTNAKDKARISRYIASKISILAKIDYFSVDRSNSYGLEIKKLTDKKINSLITKEEVERTDEVLSRVFKKINSIN